MNAKKFKEHIPLEIWKKSSLIIGCSKCKNYLFVEKSSENRERDEKQLRFLVDKNALKCPICQSKMNIVIEVEEDKDRFEIE